MTAPEVATVLSWHEALNAGDADRLVSLSHAEVEMGGPRGPARGSGPLREWVARANVRLAPRRLFHRGETVVVEQEAEWASHETGEAMGKATVGSVFVVRDGRVAGVTRHEDLASALKATNMDASETAVETAVETGATQHREPEGGRMAECTHLDQINDVQPSAEGCEDCLRIGGRWVHLRECLVCGHVGCCDSSPNRHATGHFQATQHPLIRSFEPGESWIFCYVDEVIMEPGR